MKNKLLLLSLSTLVASLRLLGQSPDFNGTWAATGVGFPPWTFTVKVTNGTVTGTATQGRTDPASGMATNLVGPFEIYEGKQDGGQITFKLKTPDGGRVGTFTGTRTGDQIAFTRSVQVLSGEPGQSGILGAAGATQFTATLNANAPAPTSTARPPAPTGPADTWNVTLVPAAPWIIELTVDGEALNGTVQQNAPGSGPTKITAGKVDGTSISFNVASPDGQRSITFRGEVRANEISFARDVAVNPGGTRGGNDIYGAGAPMQFIARRVPRTLTYRSVTVDTSAIAASPNREAIIDALRRQLDIADAAIVKPDQKTFFRSIPIAIKTSGSGYSDSTKSIALQSQVYERDKPILLQELLRAYHDQKLPEGFRNPDILRLHQQFSPAFPNVQEYFAAVASAYLHGVARDGLTREALKAKQPDGYSWLEKEFGPR